METGTALDTISGGQKIHFLAILLPLITFLFYKVHISIIIVYTILLAIHSLYIYVLMAFKSNSTKSVLYSKEKKLSEFWYIPHVWFFVIVTVINIGAFIYSFYLSIINLNLQKDYSLILFLAHIFIFTFEIFILIIMRYYKKIIPKIKKK